MKLKIGLIPPNKNHFKGKVFDSQFHRDFGESFYIELKKQLESKGNVCKTFDEFTLTEKIDVIIIYRLDHFLGYLLSEIKKNNKIKIFHVALEPPEIYFFNDYSKSKYFNFNRSFSWVKNSHITNFNYTIDIPLLHLKKNKKINKIVAIYSYKKSSNKNSLYALRFNIIKELSKLNKIDLYGVGWDKCKDEDIINCYKGKIDSKQELISKYDLCLAIENSRHRGYITEKLFDPISAGTLPLYFGCPEVKYEFDKNLFIEFKNIDETILLLNDNNKISHKYLKFYAARKQNFSNSKYSKDKTAEIIVNEISDEENVMYKYYFIYRIKLIVYAILFTKNFWRNRKFYFDLIFSAW